MFTYYKSNTGIFCFQKRSSRSRSRHKKRLWLSAPTYKKIGSGAASKLAAPGSSGSATLVGTEQVCRSSVISTIFQTDKT